MSMSFSEGQIYFFNPGSEAFPYRVRVSKTARHVRLTIGHEEGLRVTIPRRFPVEQVDRILHEKKDWIQKKMIEIGTSQSLRDAFDIRDGRVFFLHDEMVTMRFSALAPGKKRATVIREGDIVFIRSHLFAQATLKKLVRNFLVEEAKKTLPLRLEMLSRSLNISYKTLSIRSQKTRWGSASARGRISLNYKLIVMPGWIADYVMIHELSHLVQMNHSAAFWNLVGQFCPLYQEARAWLKKEGRFLSF